MSVYVTGDLRPLQRFAQDAAQLAHHAPPEREHAHHEDGTLHDRQPRADLREVVLEADHDERAHHGPEDGAEPAQERHQHDLEHYLTQIGAWLTIVQGAIFVVCVHTFRR